MSVAKQVPIKDKKNASVPGKKNVSFSDSSGLGLEGIGDLSNLLKLHEEVDDQNFGPLELDLSLIDEDPNQPRQFFDSESLSEMAETIRLRGVKTPISVRPHPEEENRYVINHGARRYRASKLANKTTIPAFIDADYTEVDQVIENLQRDSLTAREIANFIGRELAKGLKKQDVAKAIGKSNAFVTQHITLLDLPESIAQVFNLGRCRDVTVINELVTAHKKNTNEVVNWLADEKQEITRSSVRILREFLDDKISSQNDTEYSEEISSSKAKEQGFDSKNTDPNRLKKSIVQVQYNKRLARIILNRRPSSEGVAWLKFEDDGHEMEAKLIKVQLVALLEG